MQRFLQPRSRQAQRVVDRLSRHRDAAQMRRPPNYHPSSSTAYRVHMSDGVGGKSSWARYIDQATRRPGWNVAKLARESGIHRSTIFRWRNGEGGSVTVDSARRIALALGDDPDEALRAAGDLVADRALDGQDEELALIDRAPVDDDLKAVMRRKLLERRERERLDRIAYVQDLIDFAKRGED